MSAKLGARSGVPVPGGGITVQPAARSRAWV